MDAPLAPSGLFGDAVDSVVDRYQEARKQAAAFQRFLPFKGLFLKCVNPEQALVLEQEVSSLLRTEAIEVVPPLDRESGFYSRYFVVSKKDGGLRPILDLRLLNRSVRRLKFRMLTVKQVVSQIRSEDSFVTIDLKDAYFHVSIFPSHRKFLRFAFRGKAYQYRVLPFGLTLSPLNFHKVRGCCRGRPIIGLGRLSAPILSIFTIIDIGHFQNRFADNIYFYFILLLCKQTYYLQVTLFIGE